MDDVVLVQVVNGVKNLLDSLRGIFLGELAPVANTIEKLSSRGQLRNDVEFVLWCMVSRLVNTPFLLLLLLLSPVYKVSNVLWTRTNRQT